MGNHKTTHILVHGAWHGSWCWKRVRAALQSAGHNVFTPTLTGLCERSHLNSAAVDLSTHIADIVNLIKWEELSDVVLCGHSYGGAVIGGVADRVSDRIGALIYLDAFVLENGQCLFDTYPAGLRNAQIEAARQAGEGWKIPPITAEAPGVDAKDRDWVDRQCTMQPLATFQQPIHLTGAINRIKNVIYILATGFAPTPFPPF
jgi:pimeloyl-ACP methyl ester carboxylesterase